MPHAYRSLTFPGQSTSSYYNQRSNQQTTQPQNQQPVQPQNQQGSPSEYRQPAPAQSATVSQSVGGNNGAAPSPLGSSSHSELSGPFPSLMPAGSDDAETFMFPFAAFNSSPEQLNHAAIQSVSDYYGINLHGGQQNGGVGVRRRGHGKGMSQMR